jgi:hypothetical protein
MTLRRSQTGMRTVKKGVDKAGAFGLAIYRPQRENGTEF